MFVLEARRRSRNKSELRVERGMTDHYDQAMVDTRVAEGATQLTLRAQIWDVEAGEIVWEASEETRGYVNLVFPQTPAPLEKVMEVAAINLIKKMP